MLKAAAQVVDDDDDDDRLRCLLCRSFPSVGKSKGKPFKYTGGFEEANKYSESMKIKV